MKKPVTTLKEVLDRLYKIEREWDENLIDDQTMDHLAAKAALEWARSTRARILGETTS
jgi:hypothetical protein